MTRQASCLIKNCCTNVLLAPRKQLSIKDFLDHYLRAEVTWHKWICRGRQCKISGSKTTHRGSRAQRQCQKQICFFYQLNKHPSLSGTFKLFPETDVLRLPESQTRLYVKFCFAQNACSCFVQVCLSVCSSVCLFFSHPSTLSSSLPACRQQDKRQRGLFCLMSGHAQLKAGEAPSPRLN